MYVFTRASCTLCVHSVCVCLCLSAFLYRTSLLLVAGVAHWSFWPLTECCRARPAPELKATTSESNQTLRAALPAPVSCGMTGQDILPSGHLQLTAINYTSQMAAKRNRPQERF